MEQSPFCETNSCLSSKEISYLEWNMNVDCPIVKQIFVYYTTTRMLRSFKEKYRPQYNATICTLNFVVVSLLYNGYRVFPRGKVLPGRDADP